MLKWNVVLLGCSIVCAQAFAGQKTICGPSDDRTPSDEGRIARVTVPGNNNGCTITMIGRTCAVTAGHCYQDMVMAEFNTPLSEEGKIRHSDVEDIYFVARNTIVYEDEGPGRDWAVFRLRPNRLTGKFAGDVQGFYRVSFEAPAEGDHVRVTGYGADYKEGSRHFAQQTHVGEVVKIQGSIMAHRTDTMGGNSGSSVIHVERQAVVGIHSHGGCQNGANLSTLLAAHEKFQRAVKACLAAERRMKN